MPKDTFFNLSEQKKEKIIQAAKNEFARVKFEQTSIKNIVEEADIARGSFYQYFDSKEDLLRYIIELHIGDIEKNIKKSLLKYNGDLFQVFIELYDNMMSECIKKNEMRFFKTIFENIRTSENNILKERRYRRYNRKK